MSAPTEKKAFSVPTPVKATEVPPKRDYGTEHGPNLFLQKQPGFPEGWLAKSYDDGVWYDCGPLQGHFEDGTVDKGKNKGEPITRLVGDAREATRQLREAAAELGIGVSVKYFPVTNKNGTEAKDRLLIKYLGTKRKEFKPKPAAAAEVPVEAPAAAE